ncbi:hypothetical protein O6H91_09G117200 [Diphasiastrum complanatum]|uniref:Uncharacterized protein n=4 Tax=Diphasiastrum complanatum TaxID=34168 RepID=A0ACC2CTS8_DIPCM|nr:hypothetical protein O6H91_Y001100 [Diphasiastrum complanatum]KAJ7545382.1 hypothetical protein O6H91_09G117200 [Diphasiastrum complanatum]KAJ7545384.1 hypothetical protein O6H91_09G117200 [Diphasiastrum complanatum]KAJ7545386.1 hypothetical protein O6H91_09G117200 [Diphasiastrum complanatum]KAJ7545387.1 hypothetical protein O6H91_09G117200 [Diphasiastrum complanatum]
MVSTALIISTPSHSEANAASDESNGDTHVSVEKSNGKSNVAENSNGAHAAKGPGKHQAVGHKSLLKSDDLYQYILETSVYPREHKALRDLREMTARHPWNLMSTSPDEGQFLMLLLKLMNAKNTIEVIAMDIHRKNFELGYPFMEQAGVAHKIDFREGPGLDTLDALLLEEKNRGFFDFIFVDADKDNYVNYHERLMKLIKVGGMIGYDNTLWNGAVVAADDEILPKYVRYYKEYVCNINNVLASDPRIEISQVPVSDGITLCRRIL